MLTAIILVFALVIAEGALPPLIHNDLLNDVKWPTTHDYEVHDRDADQESQREDEERFTVLVPSVAQEVQDHRAQQTADRGHQVSVEVNGNSGFVDRSLEITSPVSFVNEEEIMHHSDFDRVKSKPRVFQEGKQLNGDGGFVNEGISNIPLKKSSEEEIKEGFLEVQRDSKGLSNSDEQQIPVSVVFFDRDEEDSSVDSEDSVNDSPDSNESDLGSESEALKSGDVVISESEISNENVNVQIFHNDEHKNEFLQNTTVVESDYLSDNPSFKKATSFLSAPQPVLEEAHEPHPLSTTVANTPLVKVHLLEDSSRKKESSRKVLRRNKVKEPKDSPITHISTESPGLNPPRLVKDVLPKPARRRVLVELKIRPKSEDSAVSSTTESVSTADLDDKIYDEEEEEEEGNDGDLENAPQDQVINPIQPQGPVQEDLFLHGPPPPEGIPIVPAPLPLPEEAPTKIHQPVLHHIVHALPSPPDPEDEDYHEDAFLSRYSPNFVPYPAYLGIPF